MYIQFIKGRWEMSQEPVEPGWLYNLNLSEPYAVLELLRKLNQYEQYETRDVKMKCQTCSAKGGRHRICDECFDFLHSVLETY